MVCEVCGARCVRKSRNGPLPRRCPGCKAKDKRPNGAERAAAFKVYRVRNREELNRKAKERYAANREQLRLKAREYRQRVGAAEWALRQKERNYGLSRAEFDAMLAAQGGRCAICGTDTPGGKGSWHLDHDHRLDKRDRVGHRGVLCHGCNTGIGSLGDDPDRLEAAARYLRARRAA